MALSALTPTSLVIMSITAHAGTRPRAINMIRAEVTRTLSAMGSRKRPNDDSKENRLAMKPSKKSVNEATRKIKPAAADGALPGKKQQNDYRRNEYQSSKR